MDYKSLANVTDSLQAGKKVAKPTTVEGRQVEDQANPLDMEGAKGHITDSVNKLIIIDNVFVKKLKAASREERRMFLARLTDSQRKRVLNMIKVEDSDYSKLGFISLDTLLANYVYDPSEQNKVNIDEFVKSENYFTMTESIKSLVEAVLNGAETLPEEGMADLKKGLEETPSRLEAFQGDMVRMKEPLPEPPAEEELTEEDETVLKDSAKSHVAMLFETSDFTKIQDTADALIAEFQGKNRSCAKTSEVYWKAFADAFKEQFQSKQKEIDDSLETLSHVLDDKALDKTYDNPLFDEDGNEVKNVEERSILALLVEALEAYSENPELLNTLFNKTITEGIEDTLDGEEPDEEVDVEEITEETEENKDAVNDAVKHLIRRVIQGKKVNKLVDALAKICPEVLNLNLKISDSSNWTNEIPQCDSVVADVPLTCPEYHQLYGGIPAAVVGALSEEKNHVWPFTDWCINGECIEAGGRMYRPFDTTVEEVDKRLKEAENDADRVKILGSCTVPVETFRVVTAKYDSLHLVDSRFYRPSIASKVWKMDGTLAEELGLQVSDSIIRCKEAEATLHICGSPYKLG